MAPARIIRNSSGFTLVELLAATVLLGLVATTLYGGIVSIMKLHDRSAEMIAWSTTMSRLSGALNADFTNLVNEGPEPVIATDSSIRFRVYARRPGTDSIPLVRREEHTYLVRQVSEERAGILMITTAQAGEEDTTLLVLPAGHTATFAISMEEESKAEPPGSSRRPAEAPIPLEVQLTVYETSDDLSHPDATFSLLMRSP